MSFENKQSFYEISHSQESSFEVLEQAKLLREMKKAFFQKSLDYLEKYIPDIGDQYKNLANLCNEILSANLDKVFRFNAPQSSIDEVIKRLNINRESNTPYHFITLRRISENTPQITEIIDLNDNAKQLIYVYKEYNYDKDRNIWTYFEIKNEDDLILSEKESYVDTDFKDSKTAFEAKPQNKSDFLKEYECLSNENLLLEVYYLTNTIKEQKEI